MPSMSVAWIARLNRYLQQNRSKLRVIFSQEDGLYHVQEPTKNLGKRVWVTVHRVGSQLELARHLGVGDPEAER